MFLDLTSKHGKGFKHTTCEKTARDRAGAYNIFLQLQEHRYIKIQCGKENITKGDINQKSHEISFECKENVKLNDCNSIICAVKKKIASAVLRSKSKLIKISLFT